MLSVKGKFQNGTAQPTEPLAGHEGETVIITFLDEEQPTVSLVDRSGWQALSQLVEDCAVETGVSDLAQQHDHYLYGKPKKEWGLTDCTSFVVMTQEQITIAFTSDHHFQQAGFIKLM